jgi:thiamine-monophosphate kinase
VPSESDLIDAFLAPFAGGEGVGSDCAAVRVTRGMKLVATTDAVVEGVHFALRAGLRTRASGLGRRASGLGPGVAISDGFSPEEVGWKALAVNLSDLAAAGARPRWFLCALGVPRAAGALRIASRMARGMAPLARRFDCALVGGNVTRASEWSLTITALGEALWPLMRTGARPGDALVVVGKLGDAAAGLLGSRRGLRAQRRPEPLVREGMAAARFASASIDVSDGFLRDLGHLCEMSRCGAVVEVERLPLGPAARARPDGLELALSGGEDYALLLSVPRRKLAALQRAVRCAEVGRVVRGSGVRLTEAGAPRPLPRVAGFDHLR